MTRRHSAVGLAVATIIVMVVLALGDDGQSTVNSERSTSVSMSRDVSVPYTGPSSPNGACVSGQAMDLESLKAKLEIKLRIPNHKLAGPDNVAKAWLCARDYAFIRFSSGITLDIERSQIANPVAEWTKFAGPGSGRSLGTAQGAVALISDVSLNGKGAVAFVKDGLFIAVVGNGSVTVGDLQAIAESIADY